MSWYRGRAFSPSQLMKRLMDAKQPVNFWTSRSRVGFSILSMALILTGLHSMPRSETRKPRSWPAGTPKTHFSGLSLIWIIEGFFEVFQEGATLLCLHHNIVY